jgi:hypothetical protein
LQLDDETLLDGVAYRGCVHTLRLLCSRREALSFLSFEITAHAAVSGSVEVMAWLNDNANPPVNCSIFNAAFYSKTSTFSAALREQPTARLICVVRAVRCGFRRPLGTSQASTHTYSYIQW